MESTGHRWIPLTHGYQCVTVFVSCLLSWISCWKKHWSCRLFEKQISSRDVFVVNGTSHRPRNSDSLNSRMRLGYWEFNRVLSYRFLWKNISSPLQLRHSERDDVSNHRRFDCLLIGLFRRRSKRTSKLHKGESTGDQWFPSQKASNAESVSIWWRHHDVGYVLCPLQRT